MLMDDPNIISITIPGPSDEIPPEDTVNHPSHYTRGAIECIDAIQSSMTYEEFKGYLKGNCIKYLWRAGLKGDAVEDIRKAGWYRDKLENLLEMHDD